MTRLAPGSAGKRRLAVGAVTSLTLSTLAVGGALFQLGPEDSSGASARREPAQASREAPIDADQPNLILIVTDDQRWDTLSIMPRARRLLAGHGVTFTNSFVTTPMCCPSRASLLTGQYSRHTGVYDNFAPAGGATVFSDTSTLATWLQSGGYTTALVGKYMNEYEDLGAGYVPPGWDEWNALVQNAGGYYNYLLNENGKLVHHGATPDDYSATVLTRKAVDFIRRAPDPFFLYFATAAPHMPSIAAPEDIGRPPPRTASLPPSFDERDVSDKPWRRRNRLRSPAKRRLAHLRTRMLRSLWPVDRSVAAIVRAVARKGELDDTVIAFTSDNGFLWGEHRHRGKIWPYEESIRVPLVVRVPWIKAPGVTDSHPVLNVDLAPTFADLAGVRPDTRVDGRSLVPLLRRRSSPWRSAFVVEYLGDQAQGEERPPPPFMAIRTKRHLYVEYRNGWRELYDLREDPYELRNLAGDRRYRRLRVRLAAALRDLLET